MKDEKETLRKTAESIHVMEKFDPAILADVTAPVVSLYIPCLLYTSLDRTVAVPILMNSCSYV